MNRYTVILDRPDRVTTGDANDRRFVLVEAESPFKALHEAQRRAFEEDSGCDGEPVDASYSDFAPAHLRVTANDYPFVAVLTGYCIPLLRGDVL